MWSYFIGVCVCVCVCVCVHVQMLQEKQDRVLVMEDDVHFKSFFNSGLSGVLSEANRHVPLWDFM